MQALSALADPTRQRILEMLADGAMSSGDIARHFEVSAPAISQHLKTLRAAKLVCVTVQAQKRIYELDPQGLRDLADWIARIGGFWSRKLAAVRFERLLPGPSGRVWDHLTKPELLPAWFGGESSIEPRQGGAVRLMGGHVRGIVTQWIPPRLLSYTWNVFPSGDSADSPYPESYLSLSLEPRGDQVLLVLSHVPVLERFEKQNAMGWHTFLDILGDSLEGGVARSRQEYMQRSAVRYGVDLSNLAR